MQSIQVKVAPRQRFRCGSSFFLVKTSPQAALDQENRVLVMYDFGDVQDKSREGSRVNGEMCNMKPEVVCPGVWGRIYWNGDCHSTGRVSMRSDRTGDSWRAGMRQDREGEREGCVCVTSKSGPECNQRAVVRVILGGGFGGGRGGRSRRGVYRVRVDGTRVCDDDKQDMSSFTPYLAVVAQRLSDQMTRKSLG